jgi:hypothetical protein
VDFVVLDMDLDKETPLTLGRPFLSTTKAIIDVGAGNIHGKEEKFKFRPWAEQCSMVKILNGPNPQNIQEVELKPPKIDSLIAFTKNF